jgi:hypothetical protein
MRRITNRRLPSCFYVSPAEIIPSVVEPLVVPASALHEDSAALSRQLDLSNGTILVSPPRSARDRGVVSKELQEYRSRRHTLIGMVTSHNM